ncbi:hypothetical protein MUK42_06800 [Musa troglodytarum]|uniref:Uncharacterized protein n=1 Tax=Musa troglodytarum TaxID=320322 RepID=A0A9E7I2S3_9LILI|nr:hypothetical protein MUK42_06800 [Musa troglodytarum]
MKSSADLRGRCEVAVRRGPPPLVERHPDRVGGADVPPQPGADPQGAYIRGLLVKSRSLRFRCMEEEEEERGLREHLEQGDDAESEIAREVAPPQVESRASTVPLHFRSEEAAAAFLPSREYKNEILV